MVPVMASQNRINKSDIYNSHTPDENKMLKVLQGHPVKLNKCQVRQVSGDQSGVYKLESLEKSQGFHLLPSFCSREVYKHGGARCPSFANINSNAKPFLSNSCVYEVREDKGDKRQELTKLIYANQKLKSSEMKPTPRRKYEHSKYQKIVSNAQSANMPETMIVGNSSDSSKEWIVYRDYSSLNAHSSKYGGKRNVWTEENGGSRTVEESVTERTPQNHPDGRSGLSNELEIMKPQHKENSYRDTVREDNDVDESKDLPKDLQIVDLASNKTTDFVFNNKTNSELRSPIVPASNSTGNMFTHTSLQETRSQIYPSSLCVPFSPSRSWGVCGASMQVRKTECNNRTLKQRNTLVNNDSSILSPKKEVMETTGRTIKNIACRMCRETFRPLHEVQAIPLDVANNLEKNKIQTESSHNIGQLNTHIQNLLTSPRSHNTVSHTGNIAIDLLDYLWSYQGMGRQVLGLKPGEKSLYHGNELQKYSVLKKVDKLPPLGKHKSQVETSRTDTDSEESSSGANRIHLVVKLPQAEDVEE